MRQKILVGGVLGCGVLLLSGCVSMRPATQAANNKPQPVQQTERSLASITHWTLRGAVAVRTPQKALAASLNWQQQVGKRYTLILMGPFSVGATQLTGQPGQVVLQQASHEYTASSPEQLLQQQLGWSIPVSNMYYWIRGIPAPGAVAEKNYDHYGHLITLQQQGWNIDYLSYTGVGQYDLPSKIFMRNNKVTVKLIVSNWQI